MSSNWYIDPSQVQHSVINVYPCLSVKILNLAYWEILHAFLSSVDYFKLPFFFQKKKKKEKKNLSGIPSECQTVWIQISLA